MQGYTVAYSTSADNDGSSEGTGVSGTAEADAKAAEDLESFSISYDYNFMTKYSGDTSTYVKRDSNFNLKYIVSFSTKESIQPGSLVIRLKSTLFKEREGDPINISSVAISPFTDNGAAINEKNADGTYKWRVYNADGTYTYDPAFFETPKGKEVLQTSSGAPLDYFIEYDEDGTEYYVFVNYETKTSGTTSFEVKYDNIQAFDIEDMTTWEVTPEITVRYAYEHTVTNPFDGANPETAYVQCTFTDGSGSTKTYYRRFYTDETGTASIYDYYAADGTLVYREKKGSSSDDWYTLTPEGEESAPLENAPDIVPVYDYGTTTEEAGPLTGLVDTYAKITGITKKPITVDESAPDEKTGTITYGADEVTALQAGGVLAGAWDDKGAIDGVVGSKKGTDFKPTKTGLYIFRRDIDVTTENMPTNEKADRTYEYVGYYYIAADSDKGGDGIYYALANITIADADKNSEDGYLSTKPAVQYQTTTTKTVTPVLKYVADANGAYIEAKYDQGTKDDFDDDIIINIYLTKYADGLDTEADTWTIVDKDATADLTFYYNKLLAAGKTSDKLIDRVELDKDVKEKAYKAFDYNLKISLDSVQVTYDIKGNQTGDALAGWGEVKATLTDNTDTPSKITAITWTAPTENTEP